MQLSTDESKLQRYTQAQIFMDRIALAASRVKPGDKLTVMTLKGAQKSAGGKSEVQRKAIVIKAYPHFVHTRLKSPYPGKTGCEESFLWDDIVKWNKHLWEGVQNE